MMEEFIEKWQDVRDTTDDLAEITLVTEFLEDLMELNAHGDRHFFA